jgi:hypothetical protein
MPVVLEGSSSLDGMGAGSNPACTLVSNRVRVKNIRLGGKTGTQTKSLSGS